MRSANVHMTDSIIDEGLESIVAPRAKDTCRRPEGRAHDDSARLESLIARCRRDDRDAFDELLNLISPKVTSLVERICWGQDADWLDDAGEEVMLKVYQSFPLYRGDGSFVGWCLRVCACVCVSLLRKEFRRRRRLEPLDAGRAGGEDPALVMQDAVLGRKVLEAVVRLHPHHRTAVGLCYLGGLSAREAATVLRIPIGTVKSRLAEAKHQIRRMVPLWFIEGDHEG